MTKIRRCVNKMRLQYLGIVVLLFVAGGTNALSQTCHTYGKLKEKQKFMKYDHKVFNLAWPTSYVKSIIRRISVFENISAIASNLTTKVETIRATLLDDIISENNGSSQGSLHLGRTRYERDFKIEKKKRTDGNQNLLYDDCHGRNGFFPSILDEEDEKELAILASKYGLRDMLVEARLDQPFGPTSFNGFVLAKWGHAPAAQAVKPTPNELKSNTLRHVLLYHFSHINEPGKAAISEIETLYKATTRGNTVHALCLMPKPTYQLSEDQLHGVGVAAEKLKTTSQLIYSSLSKKITLLKGIIDTASPTVGPKPANALSPGILHLGVEHFDSAIYQLSQNYYYDDSDYDHLVDINQALVWMNDALMDGLMAQNDYLSLYPSDELKDAIIETCLEKYHKKESISWDGKILEAAFAPLLSEVQLRLETADSVTATTNATVRYITSSDPVIIYKIQKYVMSSGNVLSHSYLVSDKEPYTTLKKPNTVGCLRLGTFEACSHIELELDQGVDAPVKSINCGQEMMDHATTEGCQEEAFKSKKPVLLSHQGCADDSGHVTYSDVINSGFAGTIKMECEGESPKDIEFAIGTTKINTSFLKKCDYFYNGEGIYGREDLATPDDMRHDTIVGSFTARQIKWLLPSLIVILSSILICSCVNLCPAQMDFIKSYICCICQKDGCQTWTRKMKENFANCKNCCRTKKPTILPLAEVAQQPGVVTSEPVARRETICMPANRAAYNPVITYGGPVNLHDIPTINHRRPIIMST